jgi:acetyl-CoA carboxylase biotin carboxyl carrier protein
MSASTRKAGPGLRGKMAEVRAPMSGNILKVLVKAGDQVQAEDELLVMEAMKMEVPVTAPCGGVVKSLAVSEEDTVEAETLLVVLE